MNTQAMRFIGGEQSLRTTVVCAVLSLIMSFAFLFLFLPSSYALDARQDRVNLAGVDVDGNGTDEIGVLKNIYGNQDFFVYNAFTGTEHASERAADLWNIPSGNAVRAVTGIDVNGDGIDEVAVLRQDAANDQNIYFYQAPDHGNQMMGVVSKDLWEASGGNAVVDIAGADFDGNGVDELLVLKTVARSKYALFVYSVPSSGEGSSTQVGYDEWSTVSGATILSIAGVDIDGNGTDEVAVLKRDFSDDMNVYVYDIPHGSTSVAERGADYWEITSDNDVVDIDGMDVNGDGIDELGVLRRDEGDMNFYAYTSPQGISPQTIVGQDFWNVPDITMAFGTLNSPSVSIYNGPRRIEVNLTEQRLYAWEGNTVANTFLISSGISRFPSPVGEFSVLEKIYVKGYRWSYGPGNPNNYNLPGVKHNMRFHGSFYLHGAYWHNNFGHRMSHGCINIDEPDAEWLYNWADVGVPVSIHQ